MTFDQFGYLTPYELIETDLETFEQVFVNAFNGSDTRKIIFKAYLDYLDQLQQIIGKGFYQWIDGSFITKKQNPNDIDFLTWVNCHLYDSKIKELSELRQQRFTKNNLTDGYIIPLYPQQNRKVYLNEINEKQWLFDWAEDDNKHPKGLIKIQF